VTAALLMARLSADARFCMLTEPDPAAAVTNLNSLMTQSGPADRFVTLTAAVLDYGSHAVTLVNAGNPCPLIYRRDACTVEEAISHEAGGLPLGVVDDFRYGSCQVSLAPGDRVLAFTDGVTEPCGERHSHSGRLASGASRSSRNSPPIAASTMTLHWWAWEDKLAIGDRPLSSWD
jgi:serine phosphatase RsbU (regulator of sigma subunit)